MKTYNSKFDFSSADTNPGLRLEIVGKLVELLRALGTESDVGITIAAALADQWRKSLSEMNPKELENFQSNVKIAIKLLGLDAAAEETVKRHFETLSN